jgi:hypothetical protein
MIPFSPHIDLGLDKRRMKDPRDALRQTATAEKLLNRLFSQTDKDRWEIQLLADEVGMGKTFVALAVAYSVLEAMEGKREVRDLDHCYKKILIITPPNSALFNKWGREVREFVRRCAHKDIPKQSKERFKPILVDRLDDLVTAIRRRGGNGPRVIVTTMRVFHEGKLTNYRAKRGFLLGVLFRHWGNRFNHDARDRLLRGTPWSRNELNELTRDDADVLPFTEDEALTALNRMDRPSRRQTLLEELLKACREVSAPYQRDRKEQFAESIETRLTTVYRELCVEMLNHSFPLVIVDEAHHWKNGPSQGTNGFESFAKLIAARTRRLLLLTATPFQLRPDEMLEILRISESLEYASREDRRNERRKRLVDHCKQTLQPALEAAHAASSGFSLEWAAARMSTDYTAAIWHSTAIADARTALDALLKEKDRFDGQQVRRIVIAATADLDPRIRAFFREALNLYACNRRLSSVLGELVTRHRRRTHHRLVLVGGEYVAPQRSMDRPDSHILHGASGLDVRGDAELPHYLLMRCVTDMNKGKGRSSLGSALTGCYSTLLESQDGRKIREHLRQTKERGTYFDLLLSMVGKRADPRHPKLEPVVQRTVESWRNGEKTLIFCFRINTANRLREIIDERIRRELTKLRRESQFGGETALRALRGRMTRREGDLIGLGLDRVLLSLASTEKGFAHPEQLGLQDSDLTRIARAGLKYGQDLLDDRVDRVFIHRVVEHVVAQRLQSSNKLHRKVLDQISSPEWIEWPYGVEAATMASGDDDEAMRTTERGVHHHFELVLEDPNLTEVEQLARRLQERRERARRSGAIPVLDSYFEAPSLWLGPVPQDSARPVEALTTLNRHLWELVFEKGAVDWAERRAVMQALRRAVLRENVLLRLLPTRADRNEEGWGTMLVERFLDNLPNQHESMADRLTAFVEDVVSASGSVLDPRDARYNLLDATRLRDESFVALVHGQSGDRTSRERIFAGFNTPLLPEILICTSVGAEGIDLHRHCRRVIHYDLAWNPALVEQRTGRIDRIGSKTFRERERVKFEPKPALEVGIPFLAGTYDERMFDELRMRAQTFEVLTGGDLAADNPDEGVADAEGREANLNLHPLPPQMVEDLRTHLHVWSEALPAMASNPESV